MSLVDVEPLEDIDNPILVKDNYSNAVVRVTATLAVGPSRESSVAHTVKPACVIITRLHSENINGFTQDFLNSSCWHSRLDLEKSLIGVLGRKRGRIGVSERTEKNPLQSIDGTPMDNCGNSQPGNQEARYQDEWFTIEGHTVRCHAIFHRSLSWPFCCLSDVELRPPFLRFSILPVMPVLRSST